MRVGILSLSGEVRTFTERHPISLLETLVGLCASLPFRKVPKLSFVMRLTLFLHITFFYIFRSNPYELSRHVSEYATACDAIVTVSI